MVLLNIYKWNLPFDDAKYDANGSREIKQEEYCVGKVVVWTDMFILACCLQQKLWTIAFQRKKFEFKVSVIALTNQKTKLLISLGVTSLGG